MKKEFLQRRLREGGAGAPAVMVALRVVDVVGAEGAACGDFREDVLGEAALTGVEFSGPSPAAFGARAVGGVEMRPRFELEGDEDALLRREVMLEGGAGGRGERRGGVAVEKTHEIAFAIAGDAVAQDQVVHASADVDRVNLNVALVGERGGKIGRGRREQKRAADKRAGNGGAEF